MRCSRRTFLAASFAALIASPSTWAAGFESARIAVRAEGAGPDVVLVPGLSSSPRVWATTVQALPGYRYHLVQVSGFAGQPMDGNKEGAVAAPVADEIARYIKEAGLKQPAVIGHSMGGTIGMMLAARHPDSLSRLMVVDMFPFLGAMFGPPGSTPATLAPVADKITASMRAASPDERKKRINDTITGMVNNETLRPLALEDSMKSDADVSLRAYRELILTDLRPELKNIRVPVTVLYVQPKGAPLTEAQMDGYYKASYAPLQQAVLKRVPDSAHFIMWDQPARFQAEVKEFLGNR